MTRGVGREGQLLQSGNDICCRAGRTYAAKLDCLVCKMGLFVGRRDYTHLAPGVVAAGGGCRTDKVGKKTVVKQGIF